MQLSVVQLLAVLVALATCPSTVDAAHSSLERSFARRSLTKRAINLDLNLPEVVSSILGNDEDDDEPSPPRISSSSSLPDVTAILPPTSVEPTTSLTSSSTPSPVSPSISPVSSSSVSSSTSSQEPSSSLSSASLTSSSISTSSSIGPSTTRGGGILGPYYYHRPPCQYLRPYSLQARPRSNLLRLLHRRPLPNRVQLRFLRLNRPHLPRQRLLEAVAFSTQSHQHLVGSRQESET
ncbi:hypothetical protein BDN71DRAFT_546543 [Pleurotus eryngii]|uniref:Uncharacterized protein n=1 Tax=Pleurotus eryngii TaxID=5323 RepID=A0A9P6D8V3_PLEER|nr:hypothetical protein BDN71DRAFT_546543 [Pleurotus eryngii]